jgi:hypothetical protein
MFWTPAFAGVTIQETFYGTINLSGSGIQKWIIFDRKDRENECPPPNSKNPRK